MNLVRTSAIALITSAALGFAMREAWVSNGPRSKSPMASNIKRNLLKDGDVQGAMVQARELLVQLSRNGWDRHRVPFSLLRLPDQDFVESAADRTANVPSFNVVTQASTVDSHYAALDAPYFNQLAFWCRTYVRLNRREEQAATEGVAIAPEGFFIVGWQDGRAEQVPVEEVRLYGVQFNGRTHYVPVFPGLACYSPTLGRYPDFRED
jgi:hypothetical protein